MKEDIEKIIVELDNYAAKTYSGIFDQFCNSTKTIRRNKEENVFKMQSSKYAVELKKQLERKAKLVIDDCHPKIRKEVEAVVAAKVNYYLHEFVQKCNAL